MGGKFLNGDSLKAQLVKGGLGGIFVRILAIAMSFLTSVILARSLGADQYGVYAFVISLTMMLALPVQVGLPTLVVRETATAEVSKDWPAMRGIWAWSTRAIVCISSLIIALLFLVIWFGEVWMRSDIRYALAFALFLFPLVALGSSKAAALRGLRKIFVGQLSSEVLRPLVLVLLIFAVSSFGLFELNASTAIVLFGIAATASFFAATLFLWKYQPVGYRTNVERKFNTGPWIRALLPLSLMSGMHMVNQNTDLLMLGLMRTSAEVGVYKVAVSAAGLAVFGLSAVQMICLPYVSRFFTQKDMRRLQMLASSAALVSLTLTLPIIPVFYFWGETILTILYGVDFAVANTPLLILATAQGVNAFFGIVWPLLTMTGHERTSMWGLMVSTIVNIVLNAILIPEYGAIGAAVATGTSIIVWNFIFWVAAFRHLKVDGSPLSVFKYRRLQGKY